MENKKRKVVVVGSGVVGATFAYTLMQRGLAHEIVMVDVDKKRAQGEALDMNHGVMFVPPVEIHAGDYDDCQDASVVVITAGVKRKPGQARLDLVQTNVGICRDIIGEVTRRTTKAIILVVSNPVDILTYFALKYSRLPPRQVIGSGTVLDTARFRYLLSRHYRVDPRDIHAYIVGEHGDSEVALWSSAAIGGTFIEKYCEVCGKTVTEGDRAQIVKEVRESGRYVIEAKGATYFAVSLALCRILEAIFRDENSVLTVSTLVNDFYGMKDVCLSMPCLVNREGAATVMPGHLSPGEIDGLNNSARVLRQVIEEVEKQ